MVDSDISVAGVELTFVIVVVAITIAVAVPADDCK